MRIIYTVILSILFISSFTFINQAQAQIFCGEIFDVHSNPEAIDDCDNPFEAHEDFPFLFVFGNGVMLEDASHELPLETTYDLFFQANGPESIDSVQLFLHEDENFHEVAVDEISAGTEYETFIEQAGTYTLVLNYEEELVSQGTDSLFQKIQHLLLPAAHAEVYPYSGVFTRTFTIVDPLLNAPCGIIVHPDSSNIIEDCDNPLGVEHTNDELQVKFGETVLEDEGEYSILNQSDSFRFLVADSDTSSRGSYLYRHQGEDFILEQQDLEEYTFTATGTYSIVVDGDKPVLVEAPFLQKIHSFFVTPVYAAIGGLTIITFEVTEAVEEEPEEVIDPLILEYAPILYMHEDEDYLPMNVEAFVEASSLWEKGGGNDTQLFDADSLDFSTFESYVENNATNDTYLAFSDANIQRSIDLSAAKTKYDSLVISGLATTTVYYHKMTDETDDGREFIVLQYWFFYAMNNWAEQGGFNNHEGDWESVFIFLDADSEEPQYVAFSSHLNDGEPNPFAKQYTSVRRAWSSSDIEQSGSQIKTYTSLGSHANYGNFNGGSHLVIPDPTNPIYDEISARGDVLNSFKLKSVNATSWRTFSGFWGTQHGGDGLNGPQGPRNIDVTGQNRFNKPLEWAGIGGIAEATILAVTDAIEFSEQKVKFAFNEVLDIGTTFSIDFHEEIIGFGENVEDIQLLPNFWDITSSLENGSFNARVTFTYEQAVVDALEVDEDQLATFYFNPETDTWEAQDSEVDVFENEVTFDTSHFSRYALGVAPEGPEEELALDELFDQLKETINDSELRRIYKRLLLLQVQLAERFSDKRGWLASRLTTGILNNIERKVSLFKRLGRISEDRLEKINEILGKILQKF